MRESEEERERDDGNGMSVMQLLVLEGASYSTKGLSLLILMERVMKNNKLCHEYGHVHA